MPAPQNFQVHLSGIINLLSDHLYSSDQVFVRELLQNAVDACSARSVLEPDFQPSISFTFLPDTSTLQVRDNGIGLNEEEITTFLSSIGASSKRELGAQREHFIGQFGIGLLSCFMVCENIELQTQSFSGGPAYKWTGSENGTFQVEELPPLEEAGTLVNIQLKAHKAKKFDAESIPRLLKYYGQLLAYPIHFYTFLNGREVSEQINTRFPFPEDIKAAISDDRQELLQYGKDLFGFMPLDVIALETPSGDTQGMAYILPHECNPGSRPVHKVYLKRMLLSDKIDDILPPWAFFVRAVINSSELQPTASRERFYENETLEKTRKSLGRCIRSYLIRLHDNDPVIRDNIFFNHQNAIKQMAEHDEELYRIMIPHFTFPTSGGQMTIREYRQKNEMIRHVYDLDEYRKIVSLAKQSNDLIILSRYNNDRKLLERLPLVYEGVKIEPISTMYFMDRFGELSFQDQARWADFLAIANEVLDEHGCRVQLKYISPDNLPSILNVTQMGLMKRGLLQADTDPELPQLPGVWSNIANALHQGAGQNASLFLNINNELIQQLLTLKAVETQEMFVKFLYLQALMLGRYTLMEEELAMLNDGIMKLMLSHS